jgi:DNA adenine methylase
MQNMKFLIKHENLKLIYKTTKQFWGISFTGTKKRLSKDNFHSLLGYKTLISYHESRLKTKYLIKQSPILKWVGGKKKHSAFICSKFPKVLNNYHENFLGSGAVLLQFLLEIKLGTVIILGSIFVSDLNFFLINFYKIIQSKLLLFIRFIKKILYLYNNLTNMKSKSIFYYKMRDCFNNLNYKSHTVKNAVYFYFLNKTCFRGLHRCNKKGAFNVPFGNYPLINFNENNFVEFSMLVRSVFFSCSDYAGTINRVLIGDIIYMDPPYSGKSTFINYLKEGFDSGLFFKFIRKLEEKKISYMLSNHLNDKILKKFSNNLHNIFYLEAIEGMVNIKKKTYRSFNYLFKQ